ncbi:serine carboxypeptidase, partial [Ostertagia ostertagi]
MMYYGDADVVCNFFNGKKFIPKLGLKGAGHMVPTDKPAVASHILASFLFDKNFIFGDTAVDTPLTKVVITKAMNRGRRSHFMKQAQEIKQLPGVGFELNFKHYSGFFQVSDTHLLHYWFVESQNDPTNDPLIFWFNGGPGCSSLDGLLNEMGPYVANFDGRSLRSNPYSWNKMASVVYIESPAGVGYSYSTDGNITTNDDQTSLENYVAVKQFFTVAEDFPSIPTPRHFHHGRVLRWSYVPTLTARIVDGQKDFPINLKGMALGNGYVNEKMNIDTSIRYAYGHGIIDEKTWNTLEKDCCKGCIDSCDFTQVTGHCATMVEDIFQFLWAGGLNPYDLYRDCDPNPAVNGERMSHMLKGVAAGYKSVEMAKTKSGDLMSFLRANEPLYGDAPCLNDTDVIVYMNDAKVRQALNIPDKLPKWDICSNQVTTTYQKQYGDMAPFIKKIVAANVRVLLYYGDTDMACNFMMGQQFSDQLGLDKRLTLHLFRTLGKTPWKFDRQIAGFKTLFKGLTFIT